MHLGSLGAAPNAAVKDFFNLTTFIGLHFICQNDMNAVSQKARQKYKI